MTINPEQIRAARAILDWSREDLAAATSLSADTIRRIESGSLQPRASTLSAIRNAFEHRGVEFLPNNGVARTDNTVTVLEGKDYLVRVFDDIYHTLKDTGGDVLIIGADNQMLDPELMLAENRLRAAGIRMRQIIEEGSEGQIGKNTDYRAVPSAFFHHEMKITYSTKVACCVSAKQKAIIINDASWSTFARKSFDLMWHNAAPLVAGTRTTGSAS